MAQADAGAHEHARRYELLRQIAAGGPGEGWRHGLGVLAARGMAWWMATWASLSAPGSTPGTASSTAATPRAGLPLSATTRSLPARHHGGGESSSSACASLLPAATTAAVVKVLAQMTLAHARNPARA